MMIRVFVADDHEIVRSGLKRLFADTPDIEWCGEAEDMDALLQRLPPARADVIVLDINMPGGGHPAAVSTLLRAQPPPKIVIFSMYGEDKHAVAYLRAGARAYLNKARSSLELVDVIRKVSTGRRHLISTLQDHLFKNQIDLEKTPADLLSSRELEIVRALAEGLRSTEVARALGISVSTVNSIVLRIKRKLGVRTLIEIVQVAQDHALLG
jgi:two-component system, NarL family, invasion response regulator UvrY